MKLNLLVLNFGIVFFICSTSYSEPTNLQEDWYKIDSPNEFGYLSKKLYFNEGNFKIKKTIYLYNNSVKHEIISISDKLFRPVYFRHIFSNSNNKVKIEGRFFDNVLTTIKSEKGEVTSRQDFIPRNVILKEFVYLVMSNQDLNLNMKKTFNVLDEAQLDIKPLISPITLETLKFYHLSDKKIVLLKTLDGYTQIDMFGKIYYESFDDKKIVLYKN